MTVIFGTTIPRITVNFSRYGTARPRHEDKNIFEFVVTVMWTLRYCKCNNSIKINSNSWTHSQLQRTQSPSTLSLLQNEFLLYDKLKEQSAATEDPLAWWRENESCFPLLSKIAKKYLCIAATIGLVASERVFSTSGYIVNHRRNKSKAENVDMFTFLAKNLQWWVIDALRRHWAPL